MRRGYCAEKSEIYFSYLYFLQKVKVVKRRRDATVGIIFSRYNLRLLMLSPTCWMSSLIPRSRHTVCPFLCPEESVIHMNQFNHSCDSKVLAAQAWWWDQNIQWWILWGISAADMLELVCLDDEIAEKVDVQTRASTVAWIGTKAERIVGLVRLIRLIKIIKLYNSEVDLEACLETRRQ